MSISSGELQFFIKLKHCEIICILFVFLSFRLFSWVSNFHILVHINLVGRHFSDLCECFIYNFDIFFFLYIFLLRIFHFLPYYTNDTFLNIYIYSSSYNIDVFVFNIPQLLHCHTSSFQIPKLYDLIFSSLGIFPNDIF